MRDKYRLRKHVHKKLPTMEEQANEIHETQACPHLSSLPHCSNHGEVRYFGAPGTGGHQGAKASSGGKDRAEDFKKAALDPYASMRQAYLQYRENQILK